MKRSTRRTTRRKQRTVIFLEHNRRLPRRLEFCSRAVVRMAILGLCLPAMLGFRPTAAAANFSSASERDKPYAVIFGTVWGPDDLPLYAVKIRIRRAEDKKARWELYSDHQGEFAQRVPAGKQDYVIWADLKGYKSRNGNPLQGEEVKV